MSIFFFILMFAIRSVHFFDVDKLRHRCFKWCCDKGALNGVVTLPDYSRGPELLKPFGVIDLQNESNILVAKQFTFIMDLKALNVSVNVNVNTNANVNATLT